MVLGIMGILLKDRRAQAPDGTGGVDQVWRHNPLPPWRTRCCRVKRIDHPTIEAAGEEFDALVAELEDVSEVCVSTAMFPNR